MPFLEDQTINLYTRYDTLSKPVAYRLSASFYLFLSSLPSPFSVLYLPLCAPFYLLLYLTAMLPRRPDPT